MKGTLSAAAVAALFFVIAPTLRAEEAPIPLYVADVQFSDFSAAEMKEMRSWGRAMAAEVKGGLRDMPARTPVTMENLEAQLGKERLKATLACEDVACVNRIVENFGCSESVFVVVRRVSTGKVQVTMDHVAGDEVIASLPPRYTGAEFDSIRKTVQEMAQALAGNGPTLERWTEPRPAPKEPKPAPRSTGTAPGTGSRTSTEWAAIGLRPGFPGLLGLDIDLPTFRWNHFVFRTLRAGFMPVLMALADDFCMSLTTAAGYPFHLGESGRHEVRLLADIGATFIGSDVAFSFAIESSYRLRLRPHAAFFVGGFLGLNSSGWGTIPQGGAFCGFAF
ncbi:MAG: hypothetical protein ABIK09_00865 [Pseudomonadota bacterium]